MLPKHIKRVSDLTTTHQATCNGFLEQAVAKVNKADFVVEKAKSFYSALKPTETINNVLSLTDFRDELISASGFSDKGKAKFSGKELEEALRKVLRKIFRKSNDNFREELVYRYLLTKGDTLGGSMRNITGMLASGQFIKLVATRLRKRRIKPRLYRGRSGKVQSIAWRKRKILFDKTPKFISKNIDIILLRVKDKTLSDKDLLKKRSNYLACGELKGGIDPAGADEHWKTANSALGRIRRSFPSDRKPKLFFVGAAIEAAMAQEIFDQLKSGKLNYAANLTKEKQLLEVIKWLITL